MRPALDERSWFVAPGGLGLVEVGLAATPGLAETGVARANLTTLAYRLVAFWLPIPEGGVAARRTRVHSIRWMRAHPSSTDNSASARRQTATTARRSGGHE
jgi:hypothetical protein